MRSADYAGGKLWMERPIADVNFTVYILLYNLYIFLYFPADVVFFSAFLVLCPQSQPHGDIKYRYVASVLVK